MDVSANFLELFSTYYKINLLYVARVAQTISLSLFLAYTYAALSHLSLQHSNLSSIYHRESDISMISNPRVPFTFHSLIGYHKKFCNFNIIILKYLNTSNHSRKKTLKNSIYSTRSVHANSRMFPFVHSVKIKFAGSFVSLSLYLLNCFARADVLQHRMRDVTAIRLARVISDTAVQAM